MKKAVAYCCTPSEEESERTPLDISFQEEMIKNYAKKNDFEIVNWIYDKETSSESIDRPNLGLLLEGALSDSAIEYVIVARTDSISNDIQLYGTIKGMLHNEGLTLISVTEHWTEEERKIGSIIDNVFLNIAAIEKANRKYKPSSGRKGKAKIGGYAGGRTPYGYRAVNKQLEINPEEAEVVRNIFSMRDNEKKTLVEIADELNAKGIKTQWGGEFHHTTIRTIINNRKTYEGYYRYGKNGDWVRGQQEPILKSREDNIDGDN